MTVEEFVALIPGFAEKSHADKAKLFGWYLHTYKKSGRFTAADLRACYDATHLPLPTNLNPYLSALSEQKPPGLIRDSRGYRLENRVRTALDAKYGQSRSTVVVSTILGDLPAKIPSVAERVFLSEALVCFRNSAFRASIVMAWNLAYSHLLDWIFNDPTRLAAFNAAITVRFNKKTLVVVKVSDFEELKEWELIEIANTASLYSKNITKILNEKLTRRNISAHPSNVVVTQPQAEDVITDLVNNVVLHLT